MHQGLNLIYILSVPMSLLLLLCLELLSRFLDFDRLLRYLNIRHFLVDTVSHFCRRKLLHCYRQLLKLPSSIANLSLKSPLGSLLSGHAPFNYTTASFYSLKVFYIIIIRDTNLIFFRRISPSYIEKIIITADRIFLFVSSISLLS